MLTEDQLADVLRDRLNREVAAIEPRHDLLTSLRRRQARRSLTTRAGLVAIPAAAVAVAAAMIFSTGAGAGAGAGPVAGGKAPAKSAVLTALMVRQMARESRLALARSGKAVISYRQTDNGAPNGSGTDTITFAGKNWNDVIAQANTTITIDRIVGKQFYLHTVGRDGRLHWFRDTNPAGHPRVSIPDPRSLFGLLNASARFKVVGYRFGGGQRLTILRATRQPRLRDLGWLPGVAPRAHVTRLTVWVDRHHVVHHIFLSTRYRTTTDPIYLKKSASGHLEFLVPSKAYLKEALKLARKIRGQHATVGVDPSLANRVRHDHLVAVVSADFSEFGKPQPITAPRHSIPQYGRG